MVLMAVRGCKGQRAIVGIQQRAGRRRSWGLTVLSGVSADQVRGQRAFGFAETPIGERCEGEHATCVVRAGKGLHHEDFKGLQRELG